MAKTIIAEYEEETDIEHGETGGKGYSSMPELRSAKADKYSMLQYGAFRLSDLEEGKGERYFELLVGVESDKFIDEAKEYLARAGAHRATREMPSGGKATVERWTIKLGEPSKHPCAGSQLGGRQSLVQRLGLWGAATVSLGIGYAAYGSIVGSWPLAVFGALMSTIVLARTLDRKRKDAVSAAAHRSCLPVTDPRS